MNMLLGARYEGCHIELSHKQADGINTIFRIYPDLINFLSQLNTAIFTSNLENYTLSLGSSKQTRNQ